MATYYWVNGQGTLSGAYSNNLSTITGSASFQGSRAFASYTVVYTDLVGNIISGDVIYANGVSIGTATSSATNPSGSFTTSNAASIPLTGMTASNGGTGFTLAAGDTLIFNNRSMYTTQTVIINLVSAVSINILNMTGMRGQLVSTNTSPTYRLAVTGSLIFPAARTSVMDNIVPVQLAISATTTITNGVTTIDPNSQQYGTLLYFRDIATLPSNIVVGVVRIEASATVTTNLGSITITCGRFENLLAPVRFNAGTSTINVCEFTGGGNTYYNIVVSLHTASIWSGFAYFYDGGNTFNTFTLTYDPADAVFGPRYSGIIFTGTTTANKWNLIGASNPSNGSWAMEGNTGPTRAVLAQTSGGWPVYIQGLDTDYGLQYMEGSPANTFFTTQTDNTIAADNVNIRPSPSPMMMV